MVVGGVGGWKVSRWRWIDEGQIDKVRFVRATEMGSFSSARF
jgi:hypothetical protein